LYSSIIGKPLSVNKRLGKAIAWQMATSCSPLRRLKRRLLLLVDQVGVEPVRINRRRRCDRIKLRDLRPAQLQIHRLQVIFELMGFARADDDARNDRFGEQPGDGYLGHAGLVSRGDLAHLFDDAESGLLVERKEVEARETVLAVLQIFPRVFAAQEASG